MLSATQPHSRSYEHASLRSGTILALLIFFAVPTVSAAVPEHKRAELFISDKMRQTALGQKLFSDTSLSVDNKVSCATCHQSDHAFTDGRATAIGVFGRSGTRNAPSLLNLSNSLFFWDGRETDLLALVLLPIFNNVEMGLSGEDELTRRLRDNPAYRQGFASAFPDEPKNPSTSQAARALETYLRTLSSEPSAYDRFALGGESNALTPEAQDGLELFRGRAGCSSCHRLDQRPATFTDEAFHPTSVDRTIAPQLPVQAIRLMKEPLTGAALGNEILGSKTFSELGHFVVTRDPKDIASFRTPSLRNVAVTAPYMHDGSVKSLEEAVDREIYYRALQTNRPNTLTAEERKNLVAFLQSLTPLPKR